MRATSLARIAAKDAEAERTRCRAIWDARRKFHMPDQYVTWKERLLMGESQHMPLLSALIRQVRAVQP